MFCSLGQEHHWANTNFDHHVWSCWTGNYYNQIPQISTPSHCFLTTNIYLPNDAYAPWPVATAFSATMAEFIEIHQGGWLMKGTNITGFVKGKRKLLRLYCPSLNMQCWDPFVLLNKSLIWCLIWWIVVFRACDLNCLTNRCSSSLAHSLVKLTFPEKMTYTVKYLGYFLGCLSCSVTK